MKMKLIFLFWLVSMATAAEDNAAEYLLEFGYLNKFSTEPDLLSVGLTKFQYFANLPQTGKLDDATLEQMKKKRCGVKDPNLSINGDLISIENRRRKRRYVLQGTKWDKNRLTWRLEKMGRSLTRPIVTLVLRKAFKFWSDVTNMEFVELPDNGVEVDLVVNFARYQHNDPFSFDGPGRTLAHAFYPLSQTGLSGDIHFDDDEEFTYQSPDGKNLLWVATHEIGHSIGIEHSNIRGAIMYPWYTAYTPDMKLNRDDINAAQALYGVKETVTTTTTKFPPKTTTTTTRAPPTTTTTRAPPTTTTTRAPPTTTTTRAPPTTPTTTTKRPVTTRTPEEVTTRKLTTKAPTQQRSCPRGKISAIFFNRYAREKVVVLTTKNRLFLVNREGGIYGGPVRTTNYIPRSRINFIIDSALEFMRFGISHQVFFVGEQYYIFQHFRYVSGPHNIHGDTDEYNPMNFYFPSWVTQVHAAMRWDDAGTSYLFFRDWYWNYNSAIRNFQRTERSTRYDWQGAPAHIESAYCDGELAFFVSGKNAYFIDRNTKSVNDPQHIGETWLRCGGRYNGRGLGN